MVVMSQLMAGKNDGSRTTETGRETDREQHTHSTTRAHRMCEKMFRFLHNIGETVTRTPTRAYAKTG